VSLWSNTSCYGASDAGAAQHHAEHRDGTRVTALPQSTAQRTEGSWFESKRGAEDQAADLGMSGRPLGTAPVSDTGLETTTWEESVTGCRLATMVRVSFRAEVTWS